MQALSFARSGLAQPVLISLLTLVTVALLGAVLAYWTWVWFAPRAEPRLEPAAAQSGNVASASTVFGTVPRTQAVAAPTGIAIKLLGIVAATAGRLGYAVVQLEAKQILAVQEGEDIAPGIRLAEVHADHVILERRGVRESLAWPQRTATASVAAQTAIPAAAKAAATAAAQRAASRGGRAGRRKNND